MNWKDVGESIGKFAPLLGTVVAGPGGAAIGSLIATALGVEDDAKAIADAIATDPEAMIKLKNIQTTHIEKLEQISLDRLSAELDDKANARENHKHSPMPAVITIMLTIMVAGLLYAIINKTIPIAHENLSMMMFGQVFTLWGASITYWVGTTRQSAEKDRR